MMKKVISLIFLIFNSLYSTEIISINGKKLNFYLDTSKCNFYLENPYPIDNRSKLLLFRDNPPTSFIQIYINGTLYRISQKELQTIEPFFLYDNFIKGIFNVKDIKLTIYFILTNLGKKGFDDTILSIVQLENTTTNTRNLDVRFLFDTVLGEEKKNPSLYTIGGERIEYDRIFEGSVIPVIFSGNVSMPDNEFRDGLYIYPTINNFSPRKLIVGNWKKLNIMRNIFIPEPKARFRYNPYSNPDAAVYLIYSFKLSPLEKFAFGCILSIDKIPEEKLKFKIEDETLSFQSSIVLKEDGEKKEIEELKQPPTNIVITTDTNQLNVINEKLLLYKKLNSLIDKIENKFFSTNLTAEKKEETKLPSQTSLPIAVITNLSGVDTNQIELLNREILKLQEAYEKRLKELQDYYENKLYENKFKEEKYTPRPKDRKDIDKKIKEIDKNLLLLEKLMKFNISSLPENKFKELESNIIDIERELK